MSHKVVTRWCWIAVTLSAIALVGCGKKDQKTEPPPPEVQVTTPEQRDIPTYLELVAQAQGKQDVDIRARVEGYLDSVNFNEGSFVKKGDLLYQIDPKPFQADLAEAQANLTKAKNDVTRLRPLAAQQAVSQQELDNAESAFDAAKAQAELAALNLGYTTIKSPIDGVVGITQVKAGNLVGRGESTLLTTVSQVDPIVFRVGISEVDYLKIAKKRAESGVASERDFELVLADGTVYAHKGQLEAVERAIDAKTGTLTVQISFQNSDSLLRPGQYGRVKVLMARLPGVLLAPQRAIREIQGIYQVAVVGSDSKVSLRNVTVGPRVDDLWVISDGLKPGERIVTEGLQRVRDGATVSVKAETADAAEAPKPAP